MGSSKEAEGFQTLQSAISSTSILIQSFKTALQKTTPQYPPPADSPNPLALLSDASKILKAQTTKLSLLILNKPFTPSAITYILKELSNSCLPALMSGLELCSAEKYTKCLHFHIETVLSKIWRELLNLISSIPHNKHEIDNLSNQATLASTGVLWADCDKLIHLGSKGLVTIANEKVGSNYALLEDAIAELDDWDPEEDSEDSDTEPEDANPSPSANTPTTSDEEGLQPSLQQLTINPVSTLKTRSLKHLKLIRMLYPALRKRRVLTFPDILNSSPQEALPSPMQIQALDALIAHTQFFTEETDEIAGALYAGDAADIERRLLALRAAARTCVEETKMGWKGEEDEYSAWSEKWLGRLEEVGNG